MSKPIVIGTHGVKTLGVLALALALVGGYFIADSVDGDPAVRWLVFAAFSGPLLAGALVLFGMAALADLLTAKSADV